MAIEVSYAHTGLNLQDELKITDVQEINILRCLPLLVKDANYISDNHVYIPKKQIHGGISQARATLDWTHSLNHVSIN